MKLAETKIATPDVSVVIPTWNCLKFLPRALISAQRQWGPAIEILVVDDASKDGTGEWLRQWCRSEIRARVFDGEGKGVAHARNLAIAEAKGRYIAFLDADDTWYPDKIRSQFEFHENNPQVLFSFTDYDHIHFRDETYFLSSRCFSYWPRFYALSQSQRDFCDLGALAPAHLFAENVVGTSTVMAQTEALREAGGFDETLPSAEDWDLWLKLAFKGAVGFTPKCYTGYLIRPGSESKRQILRVRAMEKIMSTYAKKVVELDPGAASMAESRLQTAYAEYHLASGEEYLAWRAHLKACVAAPSGRALRALASNTLRLIK